MKIKSLILCVVLGLGLILGGFIFPSELPAQQGGYSSLTNFFDPSSTPSAHEKQLREQIKRRENMLQHFQKEKNNTWNLLHYWAGEIGKAENMDRYNLALKNWNIANDRFTSYYNTTNSLIDQIENLQKQIDKTKENKDRFNKMKSTIEEILPPPTDPNLYNQPLGETVRGTHTTSPETQAANGESVITELESGHKQDIHRIQQEREEREEARRRFQELARRYRENGGKVGSGWHRAWREVQRRWQELTGGSNTHPPKKSSGTTSGRCNGKGSCKTNTNSSGHTWTITPVSNK